MYSQFVIAHSLPQIEHAQGYQKCLIVGNWLMLISLIAVSSAISITFGFDQHFSMAIQISAHIATIIFAGLLKIGYVLRCIALHGFGVRNF